MELVSGPITDLQDTSAEPCLSVIDVRDYLPPKKLDEGTVWFDEYTMSNGTRYRQLTGLPTHPITETALDIGTPWFTSEKGHNAHTMLKAMSLGIPARLIGPPRIWAEGSNPFSRFFGTMEQARNVDLVNDSLAFLAILNAHDDQAKFKFSIRPQESVYYGESRGAMMAFILNALAHQQERSFIFTEWIDPCNARKTTTRKIATSKNSISRGVGEVTSGIGSVVKLARQPRRRHYLSTFDPSLESVLPTIATKRTLFSGVSGDYAPTMPSETMGTVVLFVGSIANQSEEHVNILEPFENITVIEQAGYGHVGGIMDERTQLASFGRLLVVVDQIESPKSNGSIYDLDAIKSAKRAA